MECYGDDDQFFMRHRKAPPSIDISILAGDASVGYALFDYGLTIDIEPFFGFLKANLGFTRMSVRGNSNVHNEMGFALMAVNIRKHTAINTEKGTFSPEDRKNACVYLLMINTSIFI